MKLNQKRVPGVRHSRGVTLVEVLVVIAIMSIIATVVAYAVIPIYGESQKKTARLSASSLRRLVGIWRMGHPGDECPNVARLRADKMIDGESSSNDPWGSPYAIKCPEDDVVVVSPGPDKKEGTADDIVVPTEASAPKG
jgi:general secretion pathway protein G